MRISDWSSDVCSSDLIYRAIWQRFSGPVRLLMENRYVFSPFWQHHNGIAGFEDWEARFKASSRTFAQAFQNGDSTRALSFVFDRLYVLRNQLDRKSTRLDSSH